MLSKLNSGWRGQFSSPGQGHGVVVSGKTHHSRSASL